MTCERVGGTDDWEMMMGIGKWVRVGGSYAMWRMAGILQA